MNPDMTYNSFGLQKTSNRDNVLGDSVTTSIDTTNSNG